MQRTHQQPGHAWQDWATFGTAIGFFGGCYGLYLLVWSVLTHRAIRQLADQRFDTFQGAHIILRMQVRGGEGAHIVWARLQGQPPMHKALGICLFSSTCLQQA